MQSYIEQKPEPAANFLEDLAGDDALNRVEAFLQRPRLGIEPRRQVTDRHGTRLDDGLAADAKRPRHAFKNVLPPAAHAAECAHDRNGAFVETQARIRHEQVGVKRIAISQSVTIAAHPLRAVEAEKLRARRLVAAIAVGAR